MTRKYIYQLFISGSLYGHFPTKTSVENMKKVLAKQYDLSPSHFYSRKVWLDD